MKKLILLIFLGAYSSASNSPGRSNQLNEPLIHYIISEKNEKMLDLINRGQTLRLLSLASKEFNKAINQDTTTEKFIASAKPLLKQGRVSQLLLLSTKNARNQLSNPDFHLTDYMHSLSVTKNLATLYQTDPLRTMYQALQGIWSHLLPTRQAYDKQLLDGKYAFFEKGKCLRISDTKSILYINSDNQFAIGTFQPCETTSSNFKIKVYEVDNDNLLVKGKTEGEFYLVYSQKQGDNLWIEVCLLKQTASDTFMEPKILNGSTMGELMYQLKLLNARIHGNDLIIQGTCLTTLRPGRHNVIFPINLEKPCESTVTLSPISSEEDVSCMAINADGKIIIGNPNKTCLKYDPKTCKLLKD